MTGPGQTTTASAGSLAAMGQGTMKMARIGGHRVAVIRTASGVHAIDNACPHQGYGLVTGDLQGDLVTCQWHNWKYRVTDGHCVVGEEDVACHPVEIVDGQIMVSVTEPTAAEKRATLWPSLGRAMAADYGGQIARDTARLLQAGATPDQIVWSGVRDSAPRADEYGVRHELAMAADCLALAEMYNGLDRTLPVSQALSGLAEVTRDRPVRPLPAPAAGSISALLENEDVSGAAAAVLAAVEAGADAASVRHDLLGYVSAHHLSYGHGAIYTQKTFELLDRVGWANAPEILPYLAVTLAHATREDTLPYMRKLMRALAELDLDVVAAAPSSHQTGWNDEGDRLRHTLLEAKEMPLREVVDAVLGGAGVDGLLDTISLAVSERLLRHDLQVEFDLSQDFGWLDITHGLTYARAGRWAWENDPGPHTARLALFCAFLCFDTGRSERRAEVPPRTPEIEPATGDVQEAVLAGDADTAVARALGGDPETVGIELAQASLADRAGSFIVAAHLVKTSQAARQEAATTGSSLPLAAAARFLAAPRLERFVAANVHEAIDFVSTGQPPKR